MAQTQIFRSWVSLKRIFLSQCVDHAISVSFAFFLLFIALSFAQSPALETLSQANAVLGLAFFATLFFSSMIQRAFFILMFGSSFGNLCFHVRPVETMEAKMFWIGHVIESLQLAIPALWFIELLLRSQSQKIPFSLQYRFEYA